MLKGSLLVIYNKHLFVLVILIIINIRAQSLIEVLVYNFRLFIYLQVIRSRQLKFYSNPFAKLVLKV